MILVRHLYNYGSRGLGLCPLLRVVFGFLCAGGLRFEGEGVFRGLGGLGVVVLICYVRCIRKSTKDSQCILRSKFLRSASCLVLRRPSKRGGQELPCSGLTGPRRS